MDLNGLPTIPGLYLGLFATNQNGVKAYIQNFSNGFQATDPNLKTIYVKYINGGNTGQSSFASADILTITDLNNSIFSTDIIASGSNFSNSDTVIFVSAIAVNAVSGPGFQVGETVSQTTANTRAVIVSVNNTIYSDRTILNLAPVSTDLGNTNLTTTPWNFSNNMVISGLTTGTTATCIDVIGENAQGRVITDGAGRIVDVLMTDKGIDYRVNPFAAAKPVITPSAISSGSNLVAQNYLTNLVVASTSNAVGVGYAMSVTEGIIYQKGYFIEVSPQTIIVEPYDPFPNNISVIFQTQENIITPEIDPNLYDNALGSPNFTAPGANRVQLIPSLAVINTAVVTNQTDYLILTSFSEGQAWRQTQYTQFNSINDAMAERMRDEAGDFVIDPFYSTTRSPINIAAGNTVSLIVEPGKAYISGYLVEVDRDFSTEINKGINTATSSGTSITLSYDSYVRIKEVGGIFKFNIGDTINFYSGAKQFISNTKNIYVGNTTPAGSLVATASMRSLVLESGTPGTNNAIYRLYIFNLNVNAASSFSSAQSISYASNLGIADIVQVFSPSANANVAKIIGNNSTLVFNPSLGPIQQVANVTYNYRSINTGSVVSNVGTATLSLVANPNESFPYTGNANLNNAQLEDLIVVPLTNNFVYSVPITGTVTINTTTANMVGIGTSFTSVFNPGDFIIVSNSTANDMHQVISVVNDTIIIMDSNCTSGTMPTANVARYFPPNVPIPFGLRSWLSANLNVNAAILTLNFGGRFTGTTIGNVAISFSAQRTSVSPATKVANRRHFIKINTANHVANSIGPWCVGVPEVVRLDGVWLVNSTQNVVTSNSLNVTQSFYIDNNQDTDMFGPSYLYFVPSRTLNLVNKYLLVEFDCANTVISGFYTTDSYTTANQSTVFYNDMLTSDGLGGIFSSWEIPEFNDSGSYFDMMRMIDFRPIAQTTANLSLVTYNPNTTVSISNTTDYKFPVPNSILTGDFTYYLGRVDSIVIDKNGNISDIVGAATFNPMPPATPRDSMLVDQIYIPPYPNLPRHPSSLVINAFSTQIASGSINKTRIQNSVITSVLPTAPAFTSQPQGYSMAHIGELERRIQALEYYVSLNSLETLIAQQAIPSSIAQNVSRFKYGFFADDFSTTKFANTADPEWAATVYINRDQCWPKSDIINLPHKMIGTPVWIDYNLINQPLSSYKPAPPPPVINTTPNTTPNTVPNTHPNTTPNTQPNVGPPQPCSLHPINPCTWTTIGREYIQGQAQPDLLNITLCGEAATNVTMIVCGTPIYNIFQNGVITATSFEAVPLTANDISFAKAQPFFQTELNPPPASAISAFGTLATYDANRLNEPMYIYPDGDVIGGAKIVWNHNPALGTNYTIQTTWPPLPPSGANYNWWKYMVIYPMNSNNFVDCQNVGSAPIPVVNTPANVQGNTISYTQAVSNSFSNNHPTVLVDPIYPYGFNPTSNTPVSGSVSFGQVNCIPYHTYSFFVQQQNVGRVCQQVGKALGDALQADGSGHCYFTYFYSSLNPAGISNTAVLLNFIDNLQNLPPGLSSGYVQTVFQDITDKTQVPSVLYLQFGNVNNLHNPTVNVIPTK